MSPHIARLRQDRLEKLAGMCGSAGLAGAARVLKKNYSTVKRWRSGDLKITDSVASLIELRISQGPDAVRVLAVKAGE